MARPMNSMLKFAIMTAALEYVFGKLPPAIASLKRGGRPLEHQCPEEGGGKMSAPGIRELEKMAARLSATARELPPGQDRQDAFREISNFVRR